MHVLVVLVYFIQVKRSGKMRYFVFCTKLEYPMTVWLVISCTVKVYM